MTRRRDTLDRIISAVLMPGFEGTTAPGWLLEELGDGLGAVCLFGMNVISRPQVRRLAATIHSANPTVVIGIDEECGEVTRLDHGEGSATPTAAHLGRIDDVATTRDVFHAIGRDLASVGVTLDLAPDADVNSNPLNPVIGPRSFGARPDLVARHVAAAVNGVRTAGVATSVKHFPGHGDTAVDSHLGLPVLPFGRDELARRETIPFTAAIAAGTDSVMTSHILIPAIDEGFPATMSRAILTDWLRGDLGFSGAIVSDALDMQGASGRIGMPEAAVRALAAGCDLLCIGTRNTRAQLATIREGIRAAVRDGRLSESRLAEARGRAVGLSRPQPEDGAPYAPPLPRPEWVRAEAFLMRRPVQVGEDPVVARLSSRANNAVGRVEWGIGDHLGESLGVLLPGATCVDVDPEADVDTLLTMAERRPLVVQGRDVARVESLARAVVEIRAKRPDALIVDEGWPDLDGERSGLIDMATFGASRGMSLELARVLGASGRASTQDEEDA